MPIVSLTSKKQNIEAMSPNRQREVFVLVPTREGESVADLLRAKTLPFHQVLPAIAEAANAVRWVFNGSTVIMDRVQRRRVSRDEVAFLTKKFPGIFEQHPDAEELDPNDIAIDMQRERAAFEKEKARMHAEAEVNAGKLRVAALSATEAERTAVSATNRAKLAEDELASTKDELAAARDEIAKLKEKLDAALSPVKSQGGSTKLAEQLAEIEPPPKPSKQTTKPA